MRGPVRFLIPEKGVSAIDKEGQVFFDPAANQALFSALQANFRTTAHHKLIKLPLHINDEAFAQALVDAWLEISTQNHGQAKSA
jgi:uncharacterized protein (UPF0261 family)